MRKCIVATAAVVAMLMGFLVVPVGAAERPVLSVQMNYETWEVNVTYESPLSYPSRVSVVMTDADVEQPGVSDFIRIAETECSEKGSAQLKIKIGSDVEEGYYHFFASTSGLLGSDGAAVSEPLWLLNSITVEDALNDINLADSSKIAQIVYDQLHLALQLDEESDSSWRNTYLNGSKQEDYEGSYTDLNGVKQAWELATLMRDIGQVSVELLPQWLEKYKDVLQLNTSAPVYLARSEECTRILQLLCKDTSRIKSFSSLQSAFAEAIAVAEVNQGNITQKQAALEKYANVFGIKDLMDEYAQIDKVKFIRQFDNAIFNNASEVATKFRTVLAAVGTDYGGYNGGNNIGGNIMQGAGGGMTSVEISGDVNISVPEEDSAVVFWDVKTNYWAENAILTLYNQKIIEGYEDGSFQPERTVTREEFIKMLAVAFRISATDEQTTAFTDVRENDWYYPYVAAAAAHGIVKGKEDGSFGVGEKLSRQDMAIMLDRLCINQGIRLLDENSEVLDLRFTDAEEIADYAVSSVRNLTTAGIINGMPDGRFAPLEALSRAQAAKVISACVEL